MKKNQQRVSVFSFFILHFLIQFFSGFCGIGRGDGGAMMKSAEKSRLFVAAAALSAGTGAALVERFAGGGFVGGFSRAARFFSSRIFRVAYAALVTASSCARAAAKNPAAILIRARCMKTPSRSKSSCADFSAFDHASSASLVRRGLMP